ncbi:MAG: hypothetical protein K8R49_05275 [Candidatus Cloacimonetes bacterium]|nr:hypothetical protein [Candidatus Cloacimonadota bacterium]
MKRFFFLMLIVVLGTSIVFSVPPAPMKTTGILDIREYPSEIYKHSSNNRDLILPQNILAFLVEFEDIKFDLVPDYPDSLAHNKEYFEQLMFHMSSFYQDASHGNYVLTEENYTVWEDVLTVSQSMGYYGDDDLWIERICEFVQEVVELTDNDINFNDYDAIIIFHAGAGQESDVTGNNPDDLWTTFLTRKSLQAGIDPENDDFPGIETNDGIFLKEFVVCPETEWHSDLTMDDPIYGLLAILTHQFGHQVGLPTLFDNDSSNGSSYGIGAFGLMGTGVWNANGFVPPLPCAWSRYYLGWEEDNIVEIDGSIDELNLTFPMADDNETPKLYKVNISEKEYFLLENRQQNPDGSTLNGDPSFTFALLPEGQQDVYPPGHPNEGQPKFNFMENTYLGCEWDFYLPGLGGYDGNVTDGSGILIWHIDENVIEENFDPDFEMNLINADASHKGVDLEEADGIQQLDSVLYGAYSFYGSANDSYREGNNSYFGKNSYNGLFSSPTAESYYGGIQLEIYDIGESDSLMTFSVIYEWSLNADYIGENPYPAAMIDFDNDEKNEIFYPMPDGSLYLWKDSLLVDGFPHTLDSLAQLYAFDNFTKTFLVPSRNPSGVVAKLYTLSNDDYHYSFFANREWAAPIVVNPDEENPNRVFLPFNVEGSIEGEITILDLNYNVLTELPLPNRISTNLMYKNNFLFCVDVNWKLHKIDLSDYADNEINLNIEGLKPKIHSALLADIDKDEIDDIIILTKDKKLYVYDQTGSILNGFPVDVDLNAVSVPSIADVDGNGYLEVLIGGENAFVVVDKNGVISKPLNEISNPDSSLIASGVIAVDIDGDDRLEILGNISLNRFCVWKNVSNNNYEISRNYPVAFGERSLNYPIICSFSDGSIEAYIPGNNGTIFRSGLPFIENISNFVWTTEYANLQRTASYLGSPPQSSPESNKIFNRKNTYFYPNPLSRTFSKGINFHNFVQENTIILRIETYKDVDVNIKIFDIAANKIYETTCLCNADFANRIYINAGKLSSGVYFAVLKAKGKVLKLKFAVEK